VHRQTWVKESAWGGEGDSGKAIIRLNKRFLETAGSGMVCRFYHVEGLIRNHRHSYWGQWGSIMKGGRPVPR